MSTVDGINLTARSKEEVGPIIQELQRQAASKRDYIAEGEQLRYTYTREDGVGVQLALTQQSNVDDQAWIPPVCYDLTKVAHDQVAEKMGIPRAYYQRMASEAGGLLCLNVNTWLAKQPRKRFMLRTLDGAVRALLSDKFRAMDNADLFFNTFEVIEEVDAEITRADLTDTRFYLRALQPDWREVVPALGRRHGSEGDADTVVPGVLVSNSEVGMGGLNVEQFMVIWQCQNGMIGENKLRQVHIGRKQEELGWMSSEAVSAEDKALWLKVRDLVKVTFDREAFR